MPITEWELTADIARWINEIAGKDRSLPFSKARYEQRPESDPTRRDVILLGSLGQIVVTGGVRLPYQKDGSSPYNGAFVNDARIKAVKVSSRYFFTCNVNGCVLWETTPTRSTLKDQDYQSWDVAGVLKESDLEHPEAIDALKQWLPVFLQDLSKILQGTISIQKKSPDEKILDSLEAALKMPVLATMDELEKRCAKPRDKAELDAWMSSGLGWVIIGNSENIHDNLERAAQFACRGLLKKLVSHEILLRSHGGRIDKIFVPDHIDTGEDLRRHMEGYFAEAAGITGDYEAVFGGDHAAMGNRIPFYSAMAVSYWRDLIGQIHELGLSEFDNEIIGNVFERLAGPEERDKFSRLYTPAEEAVDLEPVETKAKRRSRGKFEEIAAQVFEEIKSSHPQMLLRYDPDFLDKRKPFDTFELPAEGDPESYKDLFKKQCIAFKKGKRRAVYVETKIPAQDNLVIEVARSGIRGFARFPHDEDECVRVLSEFSGFMATRRRIVRELIENRTPDEEMQEKAYVMVVQMITNSG